jgi:uncharacterized protein YfaS (alpha-2-macroglobulin family)
MFTGPRLRIALGLIITSTIAVLLARADTPAPTTSPADHRYLAALSTDKPIYRIGERVYMRCVVLGALDHIPLSAHRHSGAMLQITGPKGEILASTYGQTEDSIAAFNWDVPDAAAGGQYAATVSFPSDGFPPATRKFEIRAYRAPRLKGEIVFLRDGFGPGDTVKASLHVERAEGGIPAGATVSANAVVDGADAFTGNTKIDAAGNCSVEFKLPSQMTAGDGTLSLAVVAGGVVEPITKTIPILLKTVQLTLYPEGGDLIAGLPCRVYLEARTPSQKPADVVGVVVDSHGEKVADVRTEHEARGRFTFTPRAGEKYALHLSQPTGIDKRFPLPAVKGEGVALTSDHDITAAGEPIAMHLAATSGGEYSVTLTKRQTTLATTHVQLNTAESTPVVLTPPPTTGDGVLIATVTDSKGTSVAERLVFRRPAHALHVAVKLDKSTYLPADNATVTVTTTDDQGKPIGAVVGLTATDDSILQMIEKRDRAPRLAEMTLLENDVRELADSTVYLNESDPKAPLAMDLLLGTQGWRRFAAEPTTQPASGFLNAYGDAARRVLADLQPMQMAWDGGFGGGGGGVGELGDIRSRRLAFVANGAVINKPRGQAGAFQLEELEDKVVDGPKAGAARLDVDVAQRFVPLGAEKQEMGFRKRLADRDQMAIAALAMPAPPVIRVYAHDLPANHRASERTDFTETLYWAAGVKTDDKTGVATVSFKLNDAVTSFAVAADTFNDSGAIGEGSATITSQRPFYVESRLPLEVSSGDHIQLPIAAVNAADHPTGPIHLTFTSGKGIDVSPIDAFTIAAGGRERRIADVTIGSVTGNTDFVVRADAGDASDQVARKLLVTPLGFPTEVARGGSIDAGGTVSQTIEIPPTLVPGSVTTNIALYPTPVGNLTEALQRLIQEPNGCFEQTTSTTYPLIMAQQYFLSHTDVDPKLVAQSSELLTKGYDRLRGFECKNKGYEWFGEDPGHECLSAYGMLEFTDMSAVRSVDSEMLKNTRTWLLARRDGKGEFSHERRALHTWVADPGCSNGYCTWALLETGEKGLDPEVKWLKDRAASDSNSYVTALAANALFLAGDRDGAKAMMDRLAGAQDSDGHVRGATTTVVGSGGESLEIETTALSTLAWLRDPSFAGNVERGIHFLADSCKAGRYGSTQSTVLALRAIVGYDKSKAHPTAAGSVQLVVDDRTVGESLKFDASTQGALKLPDAAELMTPGQHTIALKMTDGSPLPYAVAVTFHSLTPSSSDQCSLNITTTLKDAQVTEGAATEARVVVTNKTDKALPTPIAIVGLPGGLEVRHEQLKELVKAERIAAYEVRGREVILYWRDMQPNQRIELPLSVTAAVPGTYTGPASRAYLYYTDEYKQWVDGMKVTIAAK